MGEINMLSIIVPFVAEWPQVAFTLRSIHEDLKYKVDHEIIAVDNYCQEVADQGFHRDRSTEMVKSMAEKNSWLRYLAYEDKLSHWNAKREAIKIANGDIYCFIDAHCIVGKDALFSAYRYYANYWKELDGTLHLPLTYHILEDKRLKYKLVYNEEKCDLHYSFTTYMDNTLREVPCMSTCGMMIHRELYELTGGWPSELGIYGGGENFINFVLSILGKKKYIFPVGTALFHHGEKRNYQFNWYDYTRNKAIATYLFGGIKWVDGYLRKRGLSGRNYAALFNDVVDACHDQRQHIKQKQITNISDWISAWSFIVDKK